MSYVEAFVAPVPNANREEYLKHAKTMAAMFKQSGALQIMECWGTNVPEGQSTSFPQAVQKEDDESVVLGWIVWPDRGTRDTAFAKMREDPRMKDFRPPFDGKRMIFGGFEPILES